MLLGSPPDMVHGVPSRRTRTSVCPAARSSCLLFMIAKLLYTIFPGLASVFFILGGRRRSLPPLFLLYRHFKLLYIPFPEKSMTNRRTFRKGAGSAALLSGKPVFVYFRIAAFSRFFTLNSHSHMTSINTRKKSRAKG